MKTANWKDDADLKATFPDADRIYGNVYVCNLTKGDRTLTVIFFQQDRLDIVWAAKHQEYERQLKNNKDSVRKFLKKKGYDI